MVTAANLIARISVDGAESASAKLLGVGSAAEETNAKISRLALGGVVIAGAALVGLGALSVKMAADFQQVMLQSEALANVSKRDGDAASAAILQMAAALGQTPLELGKGFYYIASTGATAKDSLIELALAAKAASVGNTTTEVTANALTAVLSTYGLKAKDAATITDEMVASVSAGKTEFTDYANVIGMVATNAKQAGVSFAEATSAFSALSNVMSPKQAKDAADALLQTTSRFTVLEARAKSMGLQFDINAYKSMNLEDRLKYLQKITGGNVEEIGKLIGRQNAMAAFTDLSANHFETYNNVLAQVLHSHGDLDTAFAKTSEGFNAAMGRMNAATQVLLITIGNMLLPGLTKLADAVTPMITAFTNWATSGHALSDVINYLNANTQTLVPVLSGLAAVLLAALIPATLSLAAGVIAATWPFLALGVAVGGLVALLLRFHPEITTISGAFQTMWPIIQNTGIALAVFFTPALIKAGIEAVVSAAKITYNFVASLILTGAQGWAAAGKLAVFIASLIATGAQAVISAARVTISFIASLIATASAAYASAFAVTGSFVPALGIVGVQAVMAAGKLLTGLIPALYATGVAATAALGPLGVLIAVVGIAGLAFIAMKHKSDEMQLGTTGAFDTMGNKIQRSTGRIIATSDQMKEQVAAQADQMRRRVVESFSGMAQQTYSETSTLSANAVANFQRLNGDLAGQMSSIDAMVIGYWNDVAGYISSHQITGTVNWVSSGGPVAPGVMGRSTSHFAGGTDSAPGGWSWVGERGPELMHLPAGTQIIPHDRSVAASSGGQPVQININIAGHRVAQALLPDITSEIRRATGVRF